MVKGNKINKWEIYFCNLNLIIGSEQQGLRPVIIISNDGANHNLPVSTVIPLSKYKTRRQNISD